jgi:hypothetical protein
MLWVAWREGGLKEIDTQGAGTSQCWCQSSVSGLSSRVGTWSTLKSIYREVVWNENMWIMETDEDNGSKLWGFG